MSLAPVLDPGTVYQYFPCDTESWDCSWVVPMIPDCPVKDSSR